MSRIRRLLGAAATLRRVAFASILVNVGIVITGGAVRLTGSGLGCPTVPRCTEDSFVPTPAMGIHGTIEFGNRLLTFVVGSVAVLGVVVAYAQRHRSKRTLTLAVLTFVGIPAQGILGAITVLTDLNPWVVGCHFLVSMVVLVLAYAFWRSAGGGPVYAFRAPPSLRVLAWVTVAASATVLVLGTVVTGSGPHAGDSDTPRNGLDLQMVAQLHADAVFLLVGLSVGLWFAMRAAGLPPGAARAAGTLLLVELAQALVGFVQYFTNLPVVLVAVHMGGACAVWLASLAALSAVRGTTAPPPGPPAERAERELRDRRQPVAHAGLGAVPNGVGNP